MDRTNEGAPAPPHAPPPPISAQPLQVTPDNVVELAVLFRNAANRLWFELRSLEGALQLSGPWMNDEASKWMCKFFHEYFLEGENSFIKVLQAIHKQHDAHALALENAAAQYGKTDELNAARAAQLQSQLPG